MDSTAIQRIEELTAARHMGEMPTFIGAIALPSGMKVESLEHLQESPSHQRAVYTTERLEDFCNYIKEEALAEGTVVFVKPDGSGAEGIIDFGTHDTPLWGHHRAQLTMKHSPEYAALLKACAMDLDQRALIDWLEDWQHVVIPENTDGTHLPVAQAIQKIRKVDIKAIANQTSEVGDFSAGRTAMESIEAKAGDGTPPALFALNCQVYPCTGLRSVKARLSLKTGGDKPSFRLRIIGKEALEKEIAEEIDLEINTRLNGTDVRTFVGSVAKKG